MLKDKVRIIVKGEDQTDRIRAWKEIDGRISITYSNGKTYSYKTENVRIKRSVLAIDSALKRFEYLKRIAHIVGLPDPQGGNILANRYNKIEFVNEESLLSSFLTGKINRNKHLNMPYEIFPFGFNISQRSAIIRALNNTLTIVEGPPGTGKTQTILNIIANAVMRDESIAIVSSNNSATANIHEKLQKYQVDFISAYLGNSDNKAKFIESQKPLPSDLSSWGLSSVTKNTIEKSLTSLETTLSKMLENKNKLSKIIQEYESLKLEYDHFNTYCICSDELALRYFKPSSTSAAELELWLTCEKYAKRKKIPFIITRIINYFKYGIINKDFYLSGFDMMISICQKRWYMTRIKELTDYISSLQSELDTFNETMNRYTSLSVQIFKDYLSRKYNKKERQQFEINDLWKNSEAFINEYPVILSTTYSLRSSLSSKVMYDYIIIDESSQVDLATGALALSCARKAVIVGDLKQLPNVVDSITAKKTDVIFDEYNLPEVYRYKNHSLLNTAIELFSNAPRTLLREHYRCHPKIIGFCNQKFYNNQLIILTESKINQKPLIVYKTVSGNHARENVNQRQIDVIKNEIIPQQCISDDNASIGIVTPYRNQTNALQNAFRGTNILADTVDKFQGRENNIIILSTVDNKITEFTDNANRLNVAISRAIDQLIVIINSDDEMLDKNIGDLVRYVEYNNLEIVDSNVRSVFDNLYSNYREKRNELLQKEKKISEYNSENLMYMLICKVLSKERFLKYDVSTHIPIKMILRDMEKLNDTEKQYAQNILTHVDFLIFEKIAKIPKLIIEVDGVKYHAQGSRQAERDELKNGILTKYGLPYIRFRTDESNEYERLVKALNEILLE